MAGDVCIPAVLIGCPLASAVYNAGQSVGWLGSRELHKSMAVKISIGIL